MRKILCYLVATSVFSTAVAGVLYILLREASFWHNFVFSQCIGLSIGTISYLVAANMPMGRRKIVAFAFSLPISTVVGITLAYTVTGAEGWSDPHASETLIIGLFFGCIGAITFILYEQIEAEVLQRQRIESENEKREIEAHLKLLQAQIEPHFLFNTLANVSSLIDGNPELAKTLLERLDDWLRVALARTRSHSTTLGDEIDMLENYLEIMKIRFGDRLGWHIEASMEASASAFPPMLLQPLVENAVRHGIEPKVGGGKIGIFATIDNGTLNIRVSDNGMGLADNTEPTGVGLSNVRARLKALFGDAGKLILDRNDQGGVTATLALPDTKVSS